MNIIARNITEKRKARQMTQRELADLLNVSDKTVSRWETGNQVPDALTMPLIAKALGMTLMELYGESEIDEQAESIGERIEESFDYVAVTRLKIWLIAGVFISCMAGILRYFGVNYFIGSMVFLVGTAVMFIGRMIYRDDYQRKPSKGAYLLEEMRWFGLAMAAQGTIISFCIPLCRLFSWMHTLEMLFVYGLTFAMAGLFMGYHKDLNQRMINGRKQMPGYTFVIGLLGLSVYFGFVYVNIIAGDMYWEWVDIPPISGLLYSLCFPLMLWVNFILLRKRIGNVESIDSSGVISST